MQLDPMDNQSRNVLDDDRIGRLLLKLSLPAAIGFLVMGLYDVVDIIFIGRIVGPLGIAGIAIVFPVQMLIMGIAMMVGIGGASLISRSLGAGNIHKAERTLGNAISFIIILSILITVVGLANTDFWLRLMGASETILPYARDYIVIILIGAVFPTFAIALSSLVRAEGNARVPMMGMIVSAVLNIILDAVFIMALGMGLKGAAIATVIAELIAALYFLSYYLSRKSYLKIYSRNLFFDFNTMKEILAIGISSFARTVAGSISTIFANRMLVAYGGDLAVSAFGILDRLVMFALTPGIVIGQGLQPILGFNYGAKRYDRALKAIKIAITAATICCVVVFMVLYFVPEPIIRIFTTDNSLIVLSSYAAKRVFLALYLIGFMMVGSLIFQSVGKVAKSFVTAISRPLFFKLPLIFILPLFWQLDGVWLSFPIADALTFILTLVLLIPQIKEFKSADLRAVKESVEA